MRSTGTWRWTIRRKPTCPAVSRSSYDYHDGCPRKMTSDPIKRPSHTLEDHLLGLDPTHSHEGDEADHDHDHDDFGGDYDPTESSLWAQDNITLLSVGIDIGSAGPQVIFSRAHLRRLSEDLTSRYFVVNRETA